MSLEIEEGLLKKVKAEAKKRGLKFRQVVKYGLTKFLEEAEKEKQEKAC
ncbi:MAG: hypothetical protein ACXVCY_15025 [Pseudobdellovibrionaceae bacterium]